MCSLLMIQSSLHMSVACRYRLHRTHGVRKPIHLQGCVASLLLPGKITIWLKVDHDILTAFTVPVKSHLANKAWFR